MRVSSRWIPFCFAIVAAGLGCGAPVVSDLGARAVPGPTAVPGAGRHHPDGFADPAQHGPYAKFLSEDCRGCHGAQLDGAGAAPGAPSCDGCHATGWRTNCTFCHGGSDNASGAPPRDITNQTDPAKLLFRAHTAHVTAGPNHAAFSCEQCHPARPSDILTPGHWIVGDDTPGVPEISFANGLNAGGLFGGTGSGTCTQSYCHGNGRTRNGTVVHTDPAPTCKTCHGFTGATSGMSGHHGSHVGGDIGGTCHDCHSSVVNASDAISAPALHVDGNKQTAFATSTVTLDANRRCSGSCHGKNHQNLSW